MSNRFYRGVAGRIAEIRVARGLTQEEVAARANLNRGFLARIEAGADNLSLQTLSRLALAMGVRPHEFLDGLDADSEVLELKPRSNARRVG